MDSELNLIEFELDWCRNHGRGTQDEPVKDRQDQKNELNLHRSDRIVDLHWTIDRDRVIGELVNWIEWIVPIGCHDNAQW